VNTHDGDTVEPGRKRKGRNRAAGSAQRRNKKKKNSKKKKHTNVISEVELERLRRQSEADKAEFALL
jgi:hypothetical protein